MTEDAERWLRAVARVLSLVIIAASVRAVDSGLTPGGGDYPSWGQPASLVMGAIALIGLALAWRWAAFGLLAITAGVAVGSLAAFEYGSVLSLGVALSFMTPGVLFVLSWSRVRSLRSLLTIAAAVVILLAVGGGAAYAFHQLSTGPAHPQSARLPIQGSPVDWVWSGGVTSTEAVVVAKVEEADSVRLGYAPVDSKETALVESSLRGPVYRFELSGLDPGTVYEYRLEVNGGLDDGHPGRFTTWPETDFDFTVAFGGCSSPGSNGVVFDVIHEADPDLYIITGDFFYADIADSALDSFTSEFDRTLSAPAQAALYESVPIAYTWDDHDYGPNDSGRTSPSRGAALTSYRTIVPHYPFALQGPDAPIAQAFTVGSVRFIITDTRSARTDSSVLGAEQLDWLLEELATASGSHSVVVWVSSIPWLGEAESGADSWAGFPEERGLIGRHIEMNGIENLVMLAGDAHMVALDDGSNNPDGGFPVMHAGALDRPGSEKGGPFSGGAFPGAGQFGLVEVKDYGDDTVAIKLRGLSYDGRELLVSDLVYPNMTP